VAIALPAFLAVKILNIIHQNLVSEVGGLLCIETVCVSVLKREIDFVSTCII
jgi:hypothetical protein